MNHKKKVICVGAGGHAAVVIEAIRMQGEFECVGLLDADPLKKNTFVSGIPVLGGDDMLETATSNEWHGFIIAMGAIGLQTVKQSIYKKSLMAGLEPINVIHPSSYISPSARLGKGITILPRAIVHAYAQIGDGVIVNSGSIVEHETQIGAYSHIAPGAIILGNVRIDDGVYVGAGAIIHQGLHIEKNAVIGAGAVVLSNVKASTTVVGVPAKQK